MFSTFAELAGTTAPTETDGLPMVSALSGEATIECNYLYWENDYRVVTGADGTTRPNPEGSLHQAARVEARSQNEPETNTDKLYR